MLEYLKVSSENLLPPINANSFALIIVVILVFKGLVGLIAKKVFQIQDPGRIFSDELEYSYYYHLTLVVLVVPDINWNVFDLIVWIVSYVGVGILRNALRHINERRNAMLEAIVIDRRVSGYLKASRRLGFVLATVSAAYIIMGNWCFIHARFRVNQVLMYPAILLFMDAMLMLVSSGLILNRLCYYFNNNIDDISPVYWAESAYNFLKSTIKVWHFSAFLRTFYRTSTNIFELFISPWILTILNEFYAGARTLGQSITQYNKFKELKQRMDQYLPHGNPRCQELCPICQQQLLSCRRVECGHRFHFKCIFLWIKSRPVPNCPICRKQIIPKDKRIHSGYAVEAVEPVQAFE